MKVLNLLIADNFHVTANDITDGCSAKQPADKKLRYQYQGGKKDRHIGDHSQNSPQPIQPNKIYYFDIQIATKKPGVLRHQDSIIISVCRSTDLIIIIWHFNKDTAV